MCVCVCACVCVHVALFSLHTHHSFYCLFTAVHVAQCYCTATYYCIICIIMYYAMFIIRFYRRVYMLYIRSYFITTTTQMFRTRLL